ncbi:MAG: OprO/OprP family phosphate-selective porin [Planctomycetales bacterium]
MLRSPLAIIFRIVAWTVLSLGSWQASVWAQSGPSQEDFDAVVERLRRVEARTEASGIESSPEPTTILQGADAAQSTSPPNDSDESIQQTDDRIAAFFEQLREKKYPNLEVHGAVQFDTGWYGQDQTNINEFGVLKDGADFRRTRLGVNGSIAPTINYFWQMDFAFPGRPTFTDLWMEITELPVIGTLRAGQWKQPFSLEVVSSYRFTMLPERSLLFQSFTPFRHPAVGMYDWSEDERMTWAASVYRAGQDQYGGSLASSGGYAGVARITGLPWYEDEGRRYLHLGAAYNYTAPNGRFGSFRSIPEFFIGAHDSASNSTAGTPVPTTITGTPFFVNTGNFFMNHYNLVGTEFLWVEGPLTVQSEFMYLNATRNNGKGAAFAGFYTQMGYFLTGEHRPYMKRQGALDRIKVLHDLGKDPQTGYGWGAFEAACRFSYVDLNSRDIQGGRLFDFTAGFNWYLNSYTKLQLEYIRAALDNAKFGDSITNLYSLRLQWDY